MRAANPMIVLGLALALAACNLKALAPDEAVQKAAAQAYAEFVTGQDDALLSDLPKDIEPVQQRKLIDALREIVPEGEGKPGVLVGWNTNVTPGHETSVLTYRYDYAKSAEMFTTTLERDGKSNPWRLAGLSVQPGPANAGGMTFGVLPNPPPVRTIPAGS